MAPAAAPTPAPISAPLPAPYPVPAPMAAPLPAPTAAPVAVPQPVATKPSSPRPIPVVAMHFRTVFIVKVSLSRRLVNSEGLRPRSESSLQEPIARAKPALEVEHKGAAMSQRRYVRLLR